MGLLSGLGKSLSRGFKKMTHTISGTGNVFSGLGSFFDSTQADVEDAWDDYTGKNIAMKNLDLQERQFAYQQTLNAQQQLREDNAMQRKVADLKAAGLNPVLAASGNGAPSAPLKAAPAPQMDDYSGGVREGVSQLGSLFLKLTEMKKEFAVQDAMVQKLQAEKEKAEAEAAGIRTENKYMDQYYSYRNAGMGLRNEGQAASNIAMGYHNVILENQALISESTVWKDIEGKYADVAAKQKNLLNIDADLLLKADKHLWYSYENTKAKVEADFAERMNQKKLDNLTADHIAKAITLSQLESDVELYFDTKKHYEELGYSSDVIKKKLSNQFGSVASQYDYLHNIIYKAGQNAGSFLKNLGIDVEIIPDDYFKDFNLFKPADNWFTRPFWKK